MSESTTNYDAVRRQQQLPIADILRAMQAETAETLMILGGISGRLDKQRRNLEAMVGVIERPSQPKPAQPAPANPAAPEIATKTTKTTKGKTA